LPLLSSQASALENQPMRGPVIGVDWVRVVILVSPLFRVPALCAGGFQGFAKLM